ncbi:MerR family DNA-binding transcriptional regulator [Ochrobactrum sp. CM-21-5]|nr:MerR family DNA-binding transcriptional regulator [Ochrobactrum sp. CM-21-5]MBC2886995.1 MerR family DNA-binding transcriptional regulator [Ochrobactrum sp. CM-21-5]
MRNEAGELTRISDLLTGNNARARPDQQLRTSLFRIGELAREFGLSLRALRFYEDKGLLHPRRAGVTRLYDSNDHSRLRLILFGRRIGFTLNEIAQLIDLWENGAGDTDRLRVMCEKFTEKLDELERKQLELDQSVAELRTILSRLA